jgi:hypothetical protein
MAVVPALALLPAVPTEPAPPAGLPPAPTTGPSVAEIEHAPSEDKAATDTQAAIRRDIIRPCPARE